MKCWGRRILFRGCCCGSWKKKRLLLLFEVVVVDVAWRREQGGEEVVVVEECLCHLRKNEQRSAWVAWVVVVDLVVAVAFDDDSCYHS